MCACIGLSYTWNVNSKHIKKKKERKHNIYKKLTANTKSRCKEVFNTNYCKKLREDKKKLIYTTYILLIDIPIQKELLPGRMYLNTKKELTNIYCLLTSSLSATQTASSRACTPGKSLPASSSSAAPPPVDTCEKTSS